MTNTLKKIKDMQDALKFGQKYKKEVSKAKEKLENN